VKKDHKFFSKEMIGKHAFVIFEGEMAFFDDKNQPLDYQSKKSIYDK
jgi:hypothetical protein